MHEFVEESFQTENTFNNILSIQVSLNGFSFSVVDPDNKLLYFKEKSYKISSHNLIARRFEEWFAKEPLLKQEYLEKRIIAVTNQFTLIPNHLYEKNSNDEITRIMFKDSNNMDIEETNIDELNAKLIFTLPTGLKEILKSDFNDFKILHPLKQIVASCHNDNNTNMMCLLFNGKNFTTTIFKEGTLEFVNNFEYNHINDVIYYLLTVLKKLSISSKTVMVNYTGCLIPGSGLRSTLKRYFPNHQRLASNVSVSLPISDKLISENICLFL